MNIFRWWLGIPLVTMLGCSDLGTSPVLHPGPPAPTMSESEWDPATEWPVQIRSTIGVVTIGDAYNPSNIYAWMGYDAYHATISAAATPGPIGLGELFVRSRGAPHV
ncbi:MAG TPA: hypothetical protein VEY93_08000, partial [Longimicrobium sp.]|nr:hypothetical protein [Longimicrobium sp.]